MKASEELSSREGYVRSAKSFLEDVKTKVKAGIFTEALESDQKALEVAGKLIGLAFSTERAGHLEESMGCFADALRIREAVKKDLKAIRMLSPESEAALGKLTADMASGYCMIAYSKVLGSIDKPDRSIALADAKIWAKKSLEERVALYGIKHDEVANGLELLGAIYHLSGNTTKGFSCFKEVAEIRAELNETSALDTERVCQFFSPSMRFQRFSHAQALSVIADISPEGSQEEFSRVFSENFAGKEQVSPFKFLEFLEKNGLKLPPTNMLEKRASALEDSRVGKAVRAASGVAVAGGFAAAVRGQEAAASAGGHEHFRGQSL